MGKEHWIETTLKEVVVSKKGKKPKVLKENSFPKSSPYIDIVAFETGFIKQYADNESSNLCKPTDVLVVWDGARFGLTGFGQIGSIGSTLACLTPLLIEPTYLYKFIQRHYSTIQQKPKGMATPHVDPDLFWNLEFPLPPLNEQKHIVEKLDVILPRVKIAKARLEKIPAILKKFRQSVLAAACSGRLTEDWRENNSVSFYGNDILSAIRNFRLKEYEDKCLQCEKQNKRKPKRPNLIVETEIENNTEIPVTWIVCHIGDIGDVSNGATPSRPEKKYWNGDIPWVSSGLVQNNRIKEAEEFITRDGFENSSVKLLPKGTVLLAMIGEGKTRGQSSILDIDATINQNIAGIVINHGYVISEYLQLWFLLNYIKNREVGSGTGPQALNCDRVRELGFVLPPTEEQLEIVRRVEKLFDIADSLDAKYHKAFTRVDKIEQSILAKAFRGELVEPDPDDEPAEELLKRILEEKAKLESGKKTRKKRAAK